MEAIWTAAASSMAALISVAPAAAGSWCCWRASISGLTAASSQLTLSSPTVRVFFSMARKRMALIWPSRSPAALALVKAWSATICCRQLRLATLGAPAAAAALPRRAKTASWISRGLSSLRKVLAARRMASCECSWGTSRLTRPEGPIRPQNLATSRALATLARLRMAISYFMLKKGVCVFVRAIDAKDMYGCIKRRPGLKRM